MLNEISSILNKIKEEDLDKFVQILLNHKGNRIWIIGNGGSSLTAQHFASDLANIGFNTTCLCENMARVTALTNDYGWEEVYIRQLSWMKPRDVLIAISVHGGSDDWSCNLSKASAYAKGRDAIVLALTGFDGGTITKFCDLNIVVPSERTFQIEGIHSILTHVIWQKLEDKQCNK